MRDLKWIIGLLGICILILVSISFFIPPVSAISTEVTTTPVPIKINVTPFTMINTSERN